MTLGANTFKWSSGTQGSVPFMGASGIISQNNASLFWDNGNARLGIGTATPADALHAKASNVGGVVARLTNTNATGTSAMAFWNNIESAIQGSCGYANPGSPVAASLNFFRSHGAGAADFVFIGNTTTQLRLAMTPGQAAIEFSDGISAPVSDANTGKLIYNNTSHTFQTSLNGGAFADIGGGMAIGGAVTGATAGSVLFVGAGPVLAQDNATLFWDNTNHRLGLGTNTPSHPLSVVNANAGELLTQYTNTDVTGFSGIRMSDDAGVFKGFFAYANASATVAYARGMLTMYSGGPDWVMANGVNLAFVFGMTSGSTALQMTDGATAGVGAAGTAKLRYNAGTGHLEVSLNGAAYVQVVTL